MVTSNKGLEIYDSKIDLTTFTAYVDVTINAIQYWRDRPLYLKTIIPAINQVVDYSKNSTEYIEDEDIIEYTDFIKEIDEDIKKYQEDALKLINNMKDYSVIKEDEGNDNVDFPSLDQNITTLDAFDADGALISSVQTDTNARENNNNIPVSLITTANTKTDDDYPQEGDGPSILSLPDSHVKKKLWLNSESTQETIDKIESDGKQFSIDLIQKTGELTPGYDLDRAENITNKLVSRNLEQWYGIPLICLSDINTKIEDSYILQIDTKHDWTLNLLNMTSDGILSDELRITEVQVPPDKRFIAGVNVTQNRISIYLQIEDDPNLYKKDITINNKPELKVTFYGSDQHGLKSLCGNIWDYYLWNKPFEYIKSPRSILPYMPPEAHNYDNNPSRVRGKYLYPRSNWSKPALVEGNMITIENWIFVETGYVTNFFCRDQLLDSDFTIYWYQYQHRYPTGLNTMISDNIHNNYIRYDYTNFKLIVDWNGIHYEEYLTLPENSWFQTAVRYKHNEGILIISFFDIVDDYYLEINIETGSTKFELISLWGRLNITDGIYKEIYGGVFGLLSINPKYTDNKTLTSIFNNNKLFLKDIEVKSK